MRCELRAVCRWGVAGGGSSGQAGCSAPLHVNLLTAGWVCPGLTPPDWSPTFSWASPRDNSRAMLDPGGCLASRPSEVNFCRVPGSSKEGTLIAHELCCVWAQRRLRTLTRARGLAEARPAGSWVHSSRAPSVALLVNGILAQPGFSVGKFAGCC